MLEVTAGGARDVSTAFVDYSGGHQSDLLRWI
jgi:hypothetical protein